MKRLVISITGLLAVMYLIALLAAARRAQVQGWVAAAQQSEHPQPQAISKGGSTKAGYKAPGELLAQNKKLSDKLSSLFKQQNPPITDLQSASQGFNTLGVFAAAVHISHNLGIPFDQLKTAAQKSGSLSKAIHVLKPNTDVRAEVRIAMLQASDDLDVTPGVLLAQNEQLSDKLSELLRQQNPPVTDLQLASKGFNVLAQFVVAVHISHNLGIPFDQLKTQAQTSGSLSKAIQALKPGADVKAEVSEAALQASDDLEESYSVIAKSSSPSM